MMDFKEFVEMVEAQIKNYLPGVYADAKMSLHEQRKINSEYLALSIVQEGQHMTPAINLNQFYKQYRNGKSMEAVFHEMSNLVLHERQSIDVSGLMDYDTVKKSLFIRVCNGETNQDFLKNVPHVMIEDLAVTCHIRVYEDGMETAFTPVTNDLVKTYGIRTDELFEDALKSTVQIRPPKIFNMENLEQAFSPEDLVMMGYDENEALELLSQMPMPKMQMLVVTNHTMQDGAGVIFYPEVMEEMGKRLKGNFFVLPSSLHETIVVPDNGEFDYRSLQAMVTTINATEVDMKDKLTDQVYHYDVKERIFEKASRYEERMEDRSKESQKPSLLVELAKQKEAAKAMPGFKKSSHREDVSL